MPPPTAPPPFVEEPPDEVFDPHLAALSDEAAPPMEPGPSARDLLIKELGASIVDEIQNTDCPAAGRDPYKGRAP